MVTKAMGRMRAVELAVIQKLAALADYHPTLENI